MKLHVALARRLSKWTQQTRILLTLVFRDLQARHRGTLAGNLWLVLQPAILLGTYTLIFGYVFRGAPVVAEGGARIPYVAHIALGLWPWLAFSESITRGLGAIQSHATLVKKTAIHSSLLVVAAVASTFVVHGVGVMLVFAVLWGSGVTLSPAGVPWYLLWMMSLIVPALGIAWGLAALQVFVRDVELLTSQVLALMFYATPVVYSAAMVPPWLRPVLQINPIGQVIEAMRGEVTGPGGAVPANADGLVLSLVMLAFALIFAIGYWIFNRLAPHFEDAL